MNTVKTLFNHAHNQHTLKSSFSCVGKGLHTGNKSVLSVMPGEINSGIVFIRKDINGPRSEIQAIWQNVKEHSFSLSITNALDVHVDTIEHIMAALYASDIDNARIVIDGSETPILDGSAGTFVDLINQVGKQQQCAQRHAIIIKQPISITDGDKFAAFLPSPITWLEVQSEPNINNDEGNKFTAPIHSGVFEDELAAARVFIYSDQITNLRKRGLLQSGTLQNSVLIDGGNVVNKEGLRFKDEYIRHEIVSSIADIALLGARLIGQYTGIHCDHNLNQALLKKLINDTDAWESSTVKKSQQYWADKMKALNKESPLLDEITSKFNFGVSSS